MGRSQGQTPPAIMRSYNQIVRDFKTGSDSNQGSVYASFSAMVYMVLSVNSFYSFYYYHHYDHRLVAKYCNIASYVDPKLVFH